MTQTELQATIEEMVQRIAELFSPERIILFGSHARGQAQEDSDIDLLVEFSVPVGYFDLIGMEQGLEKSLGKRVDLVTPESLSKFFRADVLREAEPIYER